MMQTKMNMKLSDILLIEMANILSEIKVLFREKGSEHWSEIFQKDFAYVVDCVIKAMIKNATLIEFPVVYSDSMKRMESILEMLNLPYETQIKKRRITVLCHFDDPDMYEEVEEEVTYYRVSI